MNVVIGTAGHIDHGKTALVKALTGVDADRLPEEKQRGITIDIGFAELDLGDIHASFVDVPGHERFVKNMLAGASGIDIVMLIVAADEGVMPQTREHFNICRLLGIKNGVVVITKSDLADTETLDLVKLEVAELVEGSFLENAKVVTTSAARNVGLNELRDALIEAVRQIQRPEETHYGFLPIDRSFSVKGHGAVVTGTLQHGAFSIESAVEVLPARLPVRIRSIQSHGRSANNATVGRRVALNLGGIDHSAIERGMAVGEKGVFEPTQALDAQVELLSDSPRPLRSRQRVRVHIGTSEVLARVTVLNESGELTPGKTDLVQLRLESPVVAVYGTRLIIRSYSPQETIAGGRVLDPLAVRHRRKELSNVRAFLQNVSVENLSQHDLVLALIARSGELGISVEEIVARTGWLRTVVDGVTAALIDASSIVKAGPRYLMLASLEALREKILAAVRRHHEADPLSKGISAASIRGSIEARDSELLSAVIESMIAGKQLSRTGELIALPGRDHTLSPAESQARKELSQSLQSAKLEVPKIGELLESVSRSSALPTAHVRKIFQTLIDAKEAIKISEDFYFDRWAIETLIAKVRDIADKSDRTLDVAKFKEISGVSRKYAIPLLEYFDREKITIRTGDKRVIR